MKLATMTATDCAASSSIPSSIPLSISLSSFRKDAAALLKRERVRKVLFVLLAAALVYAAYALIADPDPAFAAASPTGTTDFDALYNRLLGWVGGSLGKSVALAFLVVGLCVGIIRGNLTAAIVTLGAGIALAMFPAIIENLFTLGS